MLPLNIINEIVNNVAVGDSAEFILEDSAVVIVPNNYNIHLRGNTTSLIMNPGSKIMFGENSGIVCDSGAKVATRDTKGDAKCDFKYLYNS
ncbi:MAG: hypothetical protein IPM38_18850 [Ignavibacteria bacterium]|nr:hypothetical protein [Ignavibacteria bacterium]